MKSNSIIFWGVYFFLSRQVNQISTGGIRVLFRKGYIFLILLMLSLFVPVILFIRILRPLVLIRFGMLESDRVGHFGLFTELYLCRKELGDHERTVDLFYCKRPISNKQLKKMYSRVLNISCFNEILYNCNRMLPGFETHETDVRGRRARDAGNLMEEIRPHIYFTQKEESRGRATLRDIGLKDGASFVLFHARDSGYLDKLLMRRTHNHWQYHDYRDSNIQNYSVAADELTERGYYAFRMGAIVKEALDTINPKVIDYAIKYRTDFLDIYLLGKCEFILGTHNGITNAAYDLFRKPIACANATPIVDIWTWCPNSLFIFKKYWLRDAHRFMTFHEIFRSGVGRYSRSEQFEEYGIELVENTPEEIKDLAIEMDDRLKGTWQTIDDDERLQKKFWDIFPRSGLHARSGLNGEIRSRIGAKFLRYNRELLN